MVAPAVPVVIVIVTGLGYTPLSGLNTGIATWGGCYDEDGSADVIQPLLTATALRTAPCAVEVTATVPLEAAISVPLLSVGVVPSRVYRMFAPAVAVVIVTVTGLG